MRGIIQKYNHVRSKKLRKSAKGAQCMINSPVCNYNTETSVLAHLDSQYHGKGGCKADDTAAAISCSSCHDWVSLETKVDKAIRDQAHLDGVFKTHIYWFDNEYFDSTSCYAYFAVRDLSKTDDEIIKDFSDRVRNGEIQIL